MWDPGAEQRPESAVSSVTTGRSAGPAPERALGLGLRWGGAHGWHRPGRARSGPTEPPAGDPGPYVTSACAGTRRRTGGGSVRTGFRAIPPGGQAVLCCADKDADTRLRLSWAAANVRGGHPSSPAPPVAPRKVLPNPAGRLRPRDPQTQTSPYAAAALAWILLPPGIGLGAWPREGRGQARGGGAPGRGGAWGGAGLRVSQEQKHST